MPDAPVAPAVDPGSVAPPSTPNAGGAGAAPAVEAEPQSVNFDFGDGEIIEGRFEDAAPQEERFPDWDKALEEKYKEQPEILKQLKDGHFREKAWRDTGFKSAKEVRQYQQQVNELADSLGRADGLKGVDALRAEAQEWSTVYTGLAAGDIGVAEEFFRENPEAIDNLTPHMLNLWYKANPDNYSVTLSRILMGTLNQPDASGMTLSAQLTQLEQLLGDNDQAKKALQAIRQRFGVYEDLARKQPEKKAPDYDAKAKELDSRERELGLTRLQINATPVVNSAVTQAVKQMLKGKNVPADKVSDIERDVAKAFQEMQIGDPEYQRNLRDVLASGDESRVLRLLKAKIGRSMPGAAKKVVGKYLAFQGKPEPKAEAGAGGVNSGPQKLKWSGEKAPTGQGPHPDAIDFARMIQKHGRQGMRDMLERGEFYAKRDKSDVIYTW